VAGLSIVTVAPEVTHPLSGASRAAFAAARALKSLHHFTRQTYERTLHPARHLAVRRRLSTGRRPRRILVLCYGNVCRSPYLQAALLRDLAGVQVISAGFVGEGRPVPAIALELGRERGLDLSAHRSRLVSPDLVSDADLVIVMDAELGRRVAASFSVSPRKIVIAPDLAASFARARAIKDPYNQSVDAFISTFDHLDRCVATMVAVFNKNA